MTSGDLILQGMAGVGFVAKRGAKLLKKPVQKAAFAAGQRARGKAAAAVRAARPAVEKVVEKVTPIVEKAITKSEVAHPERYFPVRQVTSKVTPRLAAAVATGAGATLAATRLTGKGKPEGGLAAVGRVYKEDEKKGRKGAGVKAIRLGKASMDAKLRASGSVMTKKQYDEGLRSEVKRAYDSIVKAAHGAVVTSTDLIKKGLSRNGDEVAEGEPTARRMKESSEHILKGMQEGGGVGYGFFQPSPQPVTGPEGLSALAPIFEKYGEAGLNALRMGMDSARTLHRASMGVGGPQGGRAPLDFQRLLQKEVAKAFATINKAMLEPQKPAAPMSAGAPTPSAQQTPTP
jgi:hypothetical protein